MTHWRRMGGNSIIAVSRIPSAFGALGGSAGPSTGMVGASSGAAIGTGAGARRGTSAGAPVGGGSKPGSVVMLIDRPSGGST